MRMGRRMTMTQGVVGTERKMVSVKNIERVSHVMMIM
jgi:hypothetical protein